mmetsp:Transcript_10182/g.11429  ORF Transcript_10182/g.11429 Transcript_10182/m.11429 type:complete len:197 (+) Transcript_10182:818-1408(+)
MDEAERSEKIKELRHSIQEYNHGNLILNIEQAKIHYEHNASVEFINTFTPALNAIIKRHLEIDTYVNLLKAEHNVKYKACEGQPNPGRNILSDEPLFIQNQNSYKNLESKRMKKEKKLSLDKINEEVENLPDLYSQLNSKAFEDCLYKLLSEVTLHGQEQVITEEMVENLWSIEMFNRYPESPKVLMTYLCLFVIL